MASRSLPRAALRAAPGLAVLAAIVALTSACSSVGAAARPSTPATLSIVSPGPNSQTGPDVELQIRLDHAHIVSSNQTGGRLRGDRGHIHVSVDGQLIAMAYTLDQPLAPFSPGRHTIQVEFVATDHLPFANRVVAADSFTVQ